MTLDNTINAATAIAEVGVEYDLGSQGFAQWSSEPDACTSHPNSLEMWTFNPNGTAAAKSFTIIVP